MQPISICGLIVPYAVDNVWSTSVYMGNETKKKQKKGRKENNKSKSQNCIHV